MGKSKWGKQRRNYEASGIVTKIEDWGLALKRWSSNNFGSIHKELQLKQKLLAKAELEALSLGVNFWVRMLRCEVNDLNKETRM